jgi:hypothetical protein
MISVPIMMSSSLLPLWVVKESSGVTSNAQAKNSAKGKPFAPEEYYCDYPLR